jgi:hypothetical protein
MTDKHVSVPAGPVGRAVKKLAGPLLAWASGGDAQSDLRDPSKPVCYDERGNPLYAPLGYVFTVPSFEALADPERPVARGRESDGGPLE